MPTKPQQKLAPNNAVAEANAASNGTVKRPPVVVIMGHIDHGKSTLLDYVRKTNIVAGEAGGITQHVGAYQAEYKAADGETKQITFLDTPGHAAFTGIRERGAQAADIAVLIVSGEDGVKPQTIEAYKNIKESKLPFVVAITKIDKPNANIETTKQSLGEHEIYVEGWGGDVPVVAISAVTGDGIPELLEIINLLAELADLKTDPKTPASGVVIESTLDTRKGISATLLIKNGTLSVGTFLVAHNSWTPVRFIENFKGEKIDTAFASMPIRILGWNELPPSGAPFTTVASKKEAERLVEEFVDAKRAGAVKTAGISDLGGGTPSQALRNKGNDKPLPGSAEKRQPSQPGSSVAGEVDRGSETQVRNGSGFTAPASAEAEIVTLPLVIKADVIGSLQGVRHQLNKITHDKVALKIVSEGIGDINENDIKLAQGDPTILIVGFNVKPNRKTQAIIERAPVPINVRTFSVIYELSDFIENTLLAKVPKEYVEEVTGTAKILALFSKEKDRQVVGGKVESGEIGNGNDVRIMRRGTEIVRGKIRELQSKKIRTQEVAEGFEFGMMVEAKMEIAVGDRIEAVRTVEKK